MAGVNLNIQEGAPFQYTWTLSNPSVSNPAVAGTPVDLTNAKAECQIKDAPDSTNAAYLALSSATPTPNGSSIILGGVAGTVELNIAWQDTVGLPSGVYDVHILLGDGKTMVVIPMGAVVVTPQVTSFA